MIDSMFFEALDQIGREVLVSVINRLGGFSWF